MIQETLDKKKKSGINRFSPVVKQPLHKPTYIHQKTKEASCPYSP